MYKFNKKQEERFKELTKYLNTKRGRTIVGKERREISNKIIEALGFKGVGDEVPLDRKVLERIMIYNIDVGFIINPERVYMRLNNGGIKVYKGWIFLKRVSDIKKEEEESRREAANIQNE